MVQQTPLEVTVRRNPVISHPQKENLQSCIAMYWCHKAKCFHCTIAAEFDRKYMVAYEHLPERDLKLYQQCDKPPSFASLYCRHYFKELELWHDIACTDSTMLDEVSTFWNSYGLALSWGILSSKPRSHTWAPALKFYMHFIFLHEYIKCPTHLVLSNLITLKVLY